LGLLYKAFQGISYDSMDLAREKGKKSKNLKRTNKHKHHYTYFDDTSIKDCINEYRRGRNIE
jgi:4-aminobutyrate aminotransferase-like enzyme